MGEIGRADIGGVQTAVAVEQPRLGMKPGPRDFVGDLHLRAEIDEYVQRTAFGRPGIDACDHADPCALSYPFFKFGTEQPQPRVPHECTQEINPIGTRNLPGDLARDLDVTPSIDEQAGPTKRECRAREGRLRTAQCSAFDRFQEQARGVCDLVVNRRTMFDEHLHQSVGQGDLVGRLRAVLFGNPFERAAKEVIDMTGQELGTDG